MGIHSSKSLESNVGQGVAEGWRASPGGGQKIRGVTCGAILTTISFSLHPHP